MVFFSLAAGFLLGLAPLPDWVFTFFEHGEGVFLGAMMIFSGVLLGSDRAAAEAFKRCRPSVLMLPAATVLGSGLGGLICGAVLGFPAGASLAVSEGLCWYTLSGALVGGALGESLGAVAFLCGVFREGAALTLIPLVSARIGAWEASGCAAATSGDICLPALLRGGGSENAAAYVINGVVCTALVPLLVPLCAKI